MSAFRLIGCCSAVFAVAAAGGTASAQVRMSLPTSGLTSHHTITPGPTFVTGEVGMRPRVIGRPVVGGHVVAAGGAICDRGYVTTGSGLTVNGRYTSDNFNLAFHVGTPGGIYGGDCVPAPPVCDPTPPCVVYPPVGYPYSYYPYAYGWGWGWDNRNYVDNDFYNRYAVIDGSLVQPVYTPPQPTVAPAPEEPPPPPTTVERAEASLRAGDADDAINLFQAHLLVRPDDAPVMRSLAVALLRKGEPVQAAAMMRMAYRADPGLAEAPLSLPALFRQDREVRQALLRAVAYANEAESASGWLMAVALMQAEGRNPAARKTLEKGTRAGLEEAIVRALSDALG